MKNVQETLTTTDSACKVTYSELGLEDVGPGSLLAEIDEKSFVGFCISVVKRSVSEGLGEDGLSTL